MGKIPKPDSSHIAPAEANYRKYFLSNRDKLDPIEGIWTEYVVGTLYEDGKVIQRKEVPNRARWIVSKKGSVYTILNEYGEQNKYVASFKPGRNDSTFTFDCYFIRTKDHIITRATLVQGNRIEMDYDAPKGVLEENYLEFIGTEMNHDPDKTIVLHWRFNWLKTFPVDSN